MPTKIMKEVFISPLSGKVNTLETVPDPTFSEKMMGDGIAIEPAEGQLVSPVDGKIVTLFPTKHAIGIQSSGGLEILLHVGIDTVKMNGEGFEVLVSEGDHVKAGDPLLNFDLSLISKQAKSIMTPIVITNSTVVKSLSKTKMIEVVKGESELMTAVFEQANQKTMFHQTRYDKPRRKCLKPWGGKNNIAAVTHCVTRLRFALMDEGKVLKEKLDNIDMVKGSFSANGQFDWARNR